MKKYLYVMDYSKNVYKVIINNNTLNYNNFIEINLEKIMIFDYVGENSNTQGLIKYNSKDYDYCFTVNIFTESINNRLIEEGFRILKDKPKTYEEMTEEEKEIYNFLI